MLYCDKFNYTSFFTCFASSYELVLFIKVQITACVFTKSAGLSKYVCTKYHDSQMYKIIIILTNKINVYVQSVGFISPSISCAYFEISFYLCNLFRIFYPSGYSPVHFTYNSKNRKEELYNSVFNQT